MKKIIIIFILFLWLATMYYFLREEVFPPPSDGYEPQLKDLKEDKTHEVFSIYFRGDRIGLIETSTQKNKDGSYRLSNVTEIRLDEDAEDKNLRQALKFFGFPELQGEMKSELDLDAQFQLKKLAFHLNAESLQTQISGTVEGSDLKIDIQQGEELQQLSFPRKLNETIPQGFMPFHRMKDLKIGKNWKMRYINPLNKGTEVVQAHVTKQEQIIIEGDVYDAFLVQIQSDFFKFRTWVSKEGEVLKVELPFRIEIRRDQGKTAIPLLPQTTPKKTVEEEKSDPVEEVKENK
jgi:hypothetical protein